MRSLFGYREKAKTRLDATSAQYSTGQQPPTFGRPPPSRATVGPATTAGVAAASAVPLDSGVQLSDAVKEQPLVDAVLEHLLSAARSDAVRQEFLAQNSVDDLVEEHSLSLLVGTYNVNGHKPPMGLQLAPWLSGAADADIVIVAFQEIVPLNANNVFNDLVGGTGAATAAWDQLVSEALNPTPAAQPYISQGGHLLPRSGPEPAPNRPPQDHVDNQLPNKEPDRFTGSEGKEYEPTQTGGTDSQADGSDDSMNDGGVSQLDNALKAFMQVAAKQMVGVYLTVWVREHVLPHVRGVQITSVGTGVMNVLGNKGAVAARMRLYDTGVALVAAHLSSGQADGDELRRNYDYSEVLRRAAFPPDSATALDPAALSAPSAFGVSKVVAAGQRAGQWGSARGILDAEHALWLGDLNYRLSGIADEKARTLLRAGDLEQLAKYDELAAMRRTGRAFEGWAEGPLSFPPTYKFRRGTLAYHGDTDDDPSAPPPLEAIEEAQKIRTPAWTDRILWCSKGGNDSPTALGLKQYKSCALTASDHMPVVASFVLPVRHYDRARVEAAIEAARRRVDAAEMAALPRCELDPPSADFGALRLGEQGTCHIILRNVGQVTASYELQPLPGAMLGDPEDKSFRTSPRWATVYPEQGTLEQGAGADIRVTASITAGPGGTADMVCTQGRSRLDAVLVLRVAGGNDLFLALSGTYRPSFFGVSLSTLASLPRPLVQPESNGKLNPQGTDSLHVDTSTPARKPQAMSPVAAVDKAEFYSPTSSLNSPLADLSTDDVAAGMRHAAQQPTIPQRLGLLEASAVDGITAVDGGPDGDGADNGSPCAALGGVNDDIIRKEDPQQAALQSESPAVLALVPPELRALTNYLKTPAALHTPGLFVNRADYVTASAVTEHCKIVQDIREALDEGRPIPARAGPHDVAAVLLAFFACLPRTFMPKAAVHLCDVCVPTADAAASLLAESLAPVEWAVCRHVLGVFRAALQEGPTNGLSSAALAALLADAWFGTSPHSYGAAGANLTEQQISELQRISASVVTLCERRAAFIQLFLDTAEPRHD